MSGVDPRQLDRKVGFLSAWGGGTESFSLGVSNGIATDWRSKGYEYLGASGVEWFGPKLGVQQAVDANLLH